MRMTLITVILSVSFPTTETAATNLNVTYTIMTEGRRTAISPYIYGANWGDWGLIGDENLTVRRLGGNRLTGYNWETNYSNAGKDADHASDTYLVDIFDPSKSIAPPDFLDPDLTEADYLKAGTTQTRFHDWCRKYNEASVITLQMAGYVAADAGGVVSEVEAAQLGRWKEVIPAKNPPFWDPPNASDDVVYMNEFVNFLVSRYGDASTDAGVKFYSLDNEPSLWFETHPRIHPLKVECKELVDKSIALAAAVKNVDHEAKVLGPALFGFGAYLHLNEAKDWDQISLWGLNYAWFIDYYLDAMSEAEQTKGRRLLDVLDLHWYADVECEGAIIYKTEEPPYSEINRQVRMQSPRTLWDPDYYEHGSGIHRYNSGLVAQLQGGYLPLLPRLKESIDTYYPGTKLAFSEYSYGAPADISGGIAIADVLGIFGKYGVYLSAYWHWTEHPGSNRDYASAAFKIYRNYDGNYPTFGDVAVSAETSDKENSSVYASVLKDNDSELHVVVINKNLSSSIEGMFNIDSPRRYTSARIWDFNDTRTVIRESSPIQTVLDNSFFYIVPPLTVCHIVLKADDAIPQTHDPYANSVMEMDSWITATLEDPVEWCLGPPDGLSISLGDGGWIVLDMGQGEAIVDGNGADLLLYEDPLNIFSWPEGYSVYGSNAVDGPWNLIGTGAGTQEFDLADESGLSEARYIKVVDDADWPWTWPWEGFDLDAIEALNMEQ